MYGTPTDPIPYIAAAYGLGIILMFIYGSWQIRLRKKLRALESALNEGEISR
jgi:hypothetical protein